MADLIREEVSGLLRKEIDDPRLKSGVLVSITEVEVGDDLRYAKVFVSVLGTPEQQRTPLPPCATPSRFCASR